MASSPTTRRSPMYKDFLFDETVTLIVGPHSRRMGMHKKLLESMSPELEKHVNNNNTREGTESTIYFPDEMDETIPLFIEWAYTGGYVREDDTRLANTKQDPWASLHKHLRLCVFSDKFNIPTLKQLAESEFYAEISPVNPMSKEDTVSLVLMIGYAYDNLPNSDRILKFLMQYASWKLELLRETDEFEQLILARPGFLKKFFATLKGLSTKPTAWELQTHWGCRCTTGMHR